jgi:hypothetical protein
MAIHDKIQYLGIDDLELDAKNPRLGREFVGSNPGQPQILAAMKDWSLEELAVSFIDSGYWPHEAMLVVKEKGKNVVVEGNRRLAALKMLKATKDGTVSDRKWTELLSDTRIKQKLFDEVPVIFADSRGDIASFLGFRHVTGIKEWAPAEKAEFIAKLIEDQGLSYEEVRRRIGSKEPAVRQNYIAYRMLLQMENVDDLNVEQVEERFSVLYLSLRTEGVKKYLKIDILAGPRAAKNPVPKSHLKNLHSFARWLFGGENSPPVVKDSRQVDDFGKILESRNAVEYLERNAEPSFEVAFNLAGGDESQIVDNVNQASDLLQLALARAHIYRKSKALQKAASLLVRHAVQLARLYPSLVKELKAELNNA